AGLIKKGLPAPVTTRAGGADREGAPGQSEPKGGAGELKKEWGLDFIIWIIAKDFANLALLSLWF
ncbi:MAG: hypothetical protein P1P72_11150, partial [ANME-2 cluster archaeon]|nr:hypothetical protein [ANME-2 cluster archaeon]